MGKLNVRLSRKEMETIGRWKDKNPQASFVEAAEKHGVSYDQARNACMKFSKGELKRANIPAKKKSSKVIIPNVTSSDVSLIEIYNSVLIEIQSAEDMEYGEKVYLLDKLSSIKKKIQAVDLKTHIKSVDAKVIAEIIRRFEPDATDEEILNIFYEALEKCKNSAR